MLFEKIRCKWRKQARLLRIERDEKALARKEMDAMLMAKDPKEAKSHLGLMKDHLRRASSARSRANEKS